MKVCLILIIFKNLFEMILKVGCIGCVMILVLRIFVLIFLRGMVFFLDLIYVLIDYVLFIYYVMSFLVVILYILVIVYYWKFLFLLFSFDVI